MSSVYTSEENNLPVRRDRPSGVIDVSRLSATIRRHQESARTRREVSRAIDTAGTESVRAELLAMAIRQNLRMR